MLSGESHTVRNGVIVAVIGGVILAILGELWPPVKVVITWALGKALAFVELLGENYSVPGWGVLILALLALVSIVRFFVALRINPTPPHSGYVEDIIFQVKWRWSWAGGAISNLWCFCPTCDSELVYDDSSARSLYSLDGVKTLFICEHCNGSVMTSIDGGGKDYALGAVQREIRRKVRTSEYTT